MKCFSLSKQSYLESHVCWLFNLKKASYSRNCINKVPNSTFCVCSHFVLSVSLTALCFCHLLYRLLFCVPTLYHLRVSIQKTGRILNRILCIREKTFCRSTDKRSTTNLISVSIFRGSVTSLEWDWIGYFHPYNGKIAEHPAMLSVSEKLPGWNKVNSGSSELEEWLIYLQMMLVSL